MAIVRQTCGAVILAVGMVLLLGGSVAWGDDHVTPPADQVRCAVSDCEADVGGEIAEHDSRETSNEQEAEEPKSEQPHQQIPGQDSIQPSEDTAHEPEAATSDAAADGSDAVEPGPRNAGASQQGRSSTAAARSSAAQGQSASVAIGDNFFAPKELTVEVGTTVTWTNNGQNPHTVSADDGSFESGASQQDWILPGRTFSHTFDHAGTFPYYCRLHGGPGGQGHAGVITVTSAEDGNGGQESATESQNGRSGSDAGTSGGDAGNVSGSSEGADANGAEPGRLAQTGGQYSSLTGASMALIALGGTLLLLPRARRKSRETSVECPDPPEFAAIVPWPSTTDTCGSGLQSHARNA